MNPFWNTMLISSLILFCLVALCNCKSCLKEYRIIQSLIQPEEPTIRVENNNVFTLPVADGVIVNYINEDVTIVDID